MGSKDFAFCLLFASYVGMALVALESKISSNDIRTQAITHGYAVEVDGEFRWVEPTEKNTGDAGEASE